MTGWFFAGVCGGVVGRIVEQRDSVSVVFHALLILENRTILGVDFGLSGKVGKRTTGRVCECPKWFMGIITQFKLINL